MPPKKKVRGESSTIYRKKKKKMKEPEQSFYYKEHNGIPDPIGTYTAELWKFLYSLYHHQNALKKNWNLRWTDERVPEFPENYPTSEFLKKLKRKQRRMSKKKTKKGISRPKPHKSKGKLYTKSDIESKTRSAIVKIIPMVGYEDDELSENYPPVRALADVAGMFLESFVRRLKFHASCLAFRNSKDLWNPLETTLREWKFGGICGVVRYFYEDYAGKNIILFDKCLAEIEAINLEEHNLDVQKIEQLKLAEYQRLRQEQRRIEQPQKGILEKQRLRERRIEELQQKQQTVQPEVETPRQNDILIQAIVQSEIADVLTQEELLDKQRHMEESTEYDMECDMECDMESDRQTEEHSEETEEFQESDCIESEEEPDDHILIQESYIFINDDGSVSLIYDGIETNLLETQTPIDLVDITIDGHAQHSEWEENTEDDENDVENLLQYNEDEQDQVHKYMFLFEQD